MQIELRAENLKRIEQQLAKLSARQIRIANAKALNDVGFQIRRDMQAEIKQVFDRPTPYIVRAPKVEAATPERVSVAVRPTLDSRGQFVRGGKVGVDPQLILQAQEWGGRRADKKSEVLLRQRGYLPSGWQTAIPRQPFPDSDDGHGNIKGTFIRSLLSYLQMYAEQGYKQNMKNRARGRFEHAATASDINTKRERTVRNRRFFVAGTQLQQSIVGGTRTKNARAPLRGTQHLAPGIWCATSDGRIQPVLMFVRTPSYKPRLSMQRVYDRTDRRAYFEKRFRYRIYQATEVKL